jgi:hypothetical protein
VELSPQVSKVALTEGISGMVETAWEKVVVRAKMEMENKTTWERMTKTGKRTVETEKTVDLADIGGELENGVGVFVPKSP